MRAILLFFNLFLTSSLRVKTFSNFLRFKSLQATVQSSVNDPVLDTKKSFVQDELRPYAMKLHTRDQAPKEGQQKSQTPFTKWEVKRSDYLHFLVDSLKVYETFDEIVSTDPRYAKLMNTGLERAAALRQDIQWMKEFDSTLTIPECGAAGLEYSKQLKDIAASSPPKFLCHYYNHYFAHTAGGRMIGKRMGDLLLGGKVLKFYEWEGDVKVLLENTRHILDDMASTFTAEEKQECLEETMATFKAGGSLMSYMKAPEH